MNYTQQAEATAKKLNIDLVILDSEFKKHFADDTKERYVFKCKLKRGKKSFTFNFGQSIFNGSQEPGMYDILACLQKYDVGTFENFCDEFGYTNDSRKAERIYKAVVKEFNNMSRLFTPDELDFLNEMQ
jgi:hypothetical protein